MKNIKSLLFTAAFALVSSSILAVTPNKVVPSKTLEQVTIQNYDVSPTPYNKKAKKINCAQFVEQTYQVTAVRGAFDLKGEFALKHPKFYSITRSHGLNSVHWTGIWVYYQPSGKPYSSKIFGAEVLFNGSTTKLGVFKNKYCQGSYRITRTSK